MSRTLQKLEDILETSKVAFGAWSAWAAMARYVVGGRLNCRDIQSTSHETVSRCAGQSPTINAVRAYH